MDLIERIETATGPSRELDSEIAKAVGADHGPRTFVSIESRSCDEHAEIARRYTGSLDAALTLVPEGLSWTCGRNVHQGYYVASLNRLNVDSGEPESVAWGTASSAALALCAAALRAKGGPDA